MNYTETTVATTKDIAEGEMKQVSVGETEVLLTCIDGHYNALGAHCTHYGAPLVDGVLIDGEIICPWHHACFDGITGDRTEPPALDALPCFELRVEGEKIIVRVASDSEGHRIPTMAKYDAESDARVFVVLGGGAAGYSAAQTLREEGFAGRIVMITREDRTPYDRPNLSKEYLQGKADSEWMPLRPDEFYDSYGIEIERSCDVVSLDTGARTIGFADGADMRYDALLLAMGGTPRNLDVPGSELDGVCLLRSFNDADTIIAAAGDAARVVVVGASFIGMESASSLAQRGCDVTVVAPDSLPFQRVLGPEIGEFFKQMHEKKGVKFHLNASVASFEGKDRLETVVLDNGTRLSADLVVAGVGVTPATGFLKDVPLHNGAVIVDRQLRAADNVFAAGDIASFPDMRTGEPTRIEHWRTAEQQGCTAARAMLGQDVVYDAVPFFWSRQFDSSILYVGHASKWDDIIYQGDVASGKFLAFYCKGERVMAVAGIKRSKDMAKVQGLMQSDSMPSPDHLRKNAFS